MDPLVVGSRVTCGNVGASTGSVTIMAIVNSPYYMTTTKKTLTIDGSKTGQSIFLTNEQNGKGGFHPITLSQTHFCWKSFQIQFWLKVDIALSNDTKSVATLKDGMLFFGHKEKLLPDLIVMES